MYQAHWGLRESPFRAGRSPLHFHHSPNWDEALARLEFLVEHHCRLGLLLGDAGVGKSLLLAHLAQALRARAMAVVQLSLVGVSAGELLALVAEQLGAPADGAAPWQVWRRVADKLAEHRYQQWHTVLILDDADEASRETLEQIARFVQLDQASQPHLTTIVSAQLARTGRLAARLLELVELRIDLDHWEPADTTRFVRDALGAAGAQRETFTDAALDRLHELAGGVARHVAQLADLALVAGAGRQLAQIDADSIESVCHELAAVTVG